ncbi:MAG: TetR/AcrR family transcriptional regulator [Aquirufa sp.]
MGIIARKEKQKQEIRSLILEASMKLFVEEGFSKVSVRKIAERIQYSPTTLYLYFKDKNEILFHCCESGFEKMLSQNIALTLINDPIERLHQMGVNYLNFGLENPEYYDLMFIQDAPMCALHDMGKGWSSGDQALEALKMVVHEAMQKGLLVSTKVETVAMAVWGMVHGLVSLAIRQRLDKLVPAEDMEQTMHDSLDWLLKTMKKA